MVKEGLNHSVTRVLGSPLQGRPLHIIGDMHIGTIFKENINYYAFAAIWH